MIGVIDINDDPINLYAEILFEWWFLIFLMNGLCLLGINMIKICFSPSGMTREKPVTSEIFLEYMLGVIDLVSDDSSACSLSD